MELKTRKTRDFIEIKVDEIETTIFKDDKQQMEKMIFHLMDVIGDLAGYTDKTVQEFINEV